MNSIQNRTASGRGGLTPEEHDALMGLYDRLDSFVNLDSFDSSRILYVSPTTDGPTNTVTLNDMDLNHTYIVALAWETVGSTGYSASISEVTELYKFYEAPSGAVGVLLCIFKPLSSTFTATISNTAINGRFIFIADLTAPSS